MVRLPSTHATTATQDLTGLSATTCGQSGRLILDRTESQTKHGERGLLTWHAKPETLGNEYFKFSLQATQEVVLPAPASLTASLVGEGEHRSQGASPPMNSRFLPSSGRQWRPLLRLPNCRAILLHGIVSTLETQPRTTTTR
jgi:hypothetical protein